MEGAGLYLLSRDGALGFAIDERLQVLDVGFVQVGERCKVVRAIDEPDRQHHVTLEETVGPHHDAYQLTPVDQHVLNATQLATGRTEHHVLAPVDFNLAIPLSRHLLDAGHSYTAGQDLQVIERRGLQIRWLEAIGEVWGLAPNVGHRHRESNEVMSRRLDRCDRDHNLIGDEEGLGCQQAARERLLFLHYDRSKVESRLLDYQAGKLADVAPVARHDIGAQVEVGELGHRIHYRGLSAGIDLAS